MRVMVITSWYEADHGKAPRGVGYWQFSNHFHDMMWTFFGSYGDCKARAVQSAKAENFSTIYVLA